MSTVIPDRPETSFKVRGELTKDMLDRLPEDIYQALSVCDPATDRWSDEGTSSE